MPRKVVTVLIVVIILGVSFYFLKEFWAVRQLQKQIRLTELELKALAVEEKPLPYLYEGDIPFVVRELISHLPRGLRFDLKKVVPQAVKTEGELKKFEVELEFLSSLGNLKSYLSRLNTIKTPAYVEELLFKSAGTGEVTGRFLVSFLLLPGKSSLAGSPEAYEVKKAKVAPKRIKKVRKEVKPNLQGIWRGKETKAIINDEIVGVGEKVSGYQVLEIGENQVILEKGGRKLYLKMEEKP